MSETDKSEKQKAITVTVISLIVALFSPVGKERKYMPDRVSRCFLLLTLFMFLLALATNVTPVADLEGIAAQSTTVVSEPERMGKPAAGTPHDPIVIDGDANFSATASAEGWLGDGSPDNPYIIDGLDINPGGEDDHCISISNTRVSFTISNCSFTGAKGNPGQFLPNVAGIYLENVTHGELVNNILYSNSRGISLLRSHLNTVANNTCNSNRAGIYLDLSSSNTVTNNTCNSNDESGIYLVYSDHNTVVNNTCNNNLIGIGLWNSDSNIVINNMCTGNTLHDIYIYASDTITEMTGEFDSVVFLLIGLVGITLLGAGWWKVSAKVGQDDIIVPTSYRLASWFRKRRSLKHVDVDEPLEPDSSDQ